MTSSSETKRAATYAHANGERLYYEVNGAGSPLVVVCGAFGCINLMFGNLLLALAASRQVVAVELQSLSRLEAEDQPARYELMADGVAGLLALLGMAPTDVFGFSLGGMVAVLVATRHQEVVRKLVVVPAPHTDSHWHLDMLAEFNPSADSRRPYCQLSSLPTQAALSSAGRGRKVYRVQTPRPAEAGGWQLTIPPAFQVPSLIITGDSGSFSLSSTAELFGLLNANHSATAAGQVSPLSQLLVLPNTTHVALLGRAEVLATVLQGFLTA
jgi:pimeloyl-ACP methyl ester carboxylesterase